MNLIRIGDKVVSRERIEEFVDRFLALRAEGLSQQDVAQKLGVDRTLISRLESIGEVRKGGPTGLIAFPVANPKQLLTLAEEAGLELAVVMNNAQRWEFLEQRDGPGLLREIMGIVARARDCDRVIVAASSMWIGLAESLLGPRLIAISLGSTPIREDVHVDPNQIRELIRASSAAIVQGTESGSVPDN